MEPLLAVFALKVANGNGTGICLYEGLDAMTKMLSQLVGPGLMLAVSSGCLLVARLKQYVHCSRQIGFINDNQAEMEVESATETINPTAEADDKTAEQRAHTFQLQATKLLGEDSDDSEDSNPDEPEIEAFALNVQVWKNTLFMVALFNYSAVAQVTLQLLDCRTFGTQKLAYFAPPYRCYEDFNGWQYLLFVTALLVSTFPVCHLCHIQTTQRWPFITGSAVQ